MGVHQRFEHAVAALHHLSARRFEVRHDHYRDPCGLRRANGISIVRLPERNCPVNDSLTLPISSALWRHRHATKPRCSSESTQGAPG